MLLYYIRHGEPIYNPDQLTELGKKQAEALSHRLAFCNLDGIYSSSSNRAIQTAQPTADKLNLPIKILDECNENYVWDGFTAMDKSDNRTKWFYQIEEIRRLFLSDKISKLGKRWYECELIASESLTSNVRRIENFTFNFLRNLGYRHVSEENLYLAENPNEKKIALFAHEAFGMAFLSTLLDIPYPVFCTHFGLSHSGVTVISFNGDSKVIPCVRQLSNDSHLYKNALPTDV